MILIQQIYDRLKNKNIRSIDFCKSVYSTLTKEQLIDILRYWKIHVSKNFTKPVLINVLLCMKLFYKPLLSIQLPTKAELTQIEKDHKSFYLKVDPNSLLTSEFTKTMSTKMFKNRILIGIKYSSTKQINRMLKQQSIFINHLSGMEIILLFSYSYNSFKHINKYLIEKLTKDSFYQWIIPKIDNKKFNSFNILLPLFIYIVFTIDKPYFDNIPNVIVEEYKSKYINDPKLILDINTFLNEQCKNRNFNEFEIFRFMNTFVNLLSDIFLKSPPLEEEIIIYRGVQDEYIYNFLYLEGNEKYTYNPNFSSGSLNFSYAIGYMKIPCCLLIIIIPKGAQIIFLEGVTFYENEYEVVLPADSVFKIVKDEMIGKRRFITLEYMIRKKTPVGTPERSASS